MEVLVRENCKYCNGEGIITHPLWIEFHNFEEAHFTLTNEALSLIEVRKWFNNNGHTTLPKEEYDCNECGGTGKQEYWLDLVDLKGSLKFATKS